MPEHVHSFRWEPGQPGHGTCHCGADAPFPVAPTTERDQLHANDRGFSLLTVERDRGDGTVVTQLSIDPEGQDFWIMLDYQPPPYADGDAEVEMLLTRDQMFELHKWLTERLYG